MSHLFSIFLYYLKFYNKHVYCIIRQNTVFRLKEKSATRSGTPFMGRLGQVPWKHRVERGINWPIIAASMCPGSGDFFVTPNSISRSELFIRIISFLMSWSFHSLPVCLDDIISEIYVTWLLFLDAISSCVPYISVCLNDIWRSCHLSRFNCFHYSFPGKFPDISAQIWSWFQQRGWEMTQAYEFQVQAQIFHFSAVWPWVTRIALGLTFKVCIKRGEEGS